jgi:tripartite-type tricarboxylate transporter receptor subunit TctC
MNAIVVGLATLLLAVAVSAQDWPTKPLGIVVPFAPGGSSDVFGRAVAQHLQGVLGLSVVNDNRPGGGSVIGTDAVAKSATATRAPQRSRRAFGADRRGGAPAHTRPRLAPTSTPTDDGRQSSKLIGRPTMSLSAVVASALA